MGENKVHHNQKQYDKIGKNYNTIKELPFSFFERQNFHAAMEPYIRKWPNPKILDLACGTGFISRALIDMGAGNVLGIDISTSMIEGGRADMRPVDEGKLKFAVGDARSLPAVDLEGNKVGNGGGQFDIVTGTWMLNYAESEEEMTQMWESVAANLKDGGVFVGLVPKAEDDLDACLERRARFNEENPQYFRVTWERQFKLPNGQGYRARMIGHDENNFQFAWYHLRKDIHESAARAGGMKGEFRWLKTSLDADVEKLASQEYWQKYNEFGQHFSLMAVEK